MTQRRESGRLPLVAVLGLLAAFVVAAPAQAADDTPPTETAAPAAAPDESVERFAPYWSPQWAFFDSHPYFDLAFVSAQGPVAPDIADRDWDSLLHHGILFGGGGRFLLGPLLVDVGMDVSSALAVERSPGFLQTIVEYNRPGFLRFVSHYGVGWVSPPAPWDGTTRLSVHAELGIGVGSHLTYSHMAEFIARPAVVFSAFGRVPKKEDGLGVVLKIGRLVSNVPRPDARVHLPDRGFDGIWAQVGLRIVGKPPKPLPQPKVGLPQPKAKPKPPPKPEPEPEPLTGDTDGDGVDDSADGCINDPEDMDNWADEDGCPDLDNDEDGIPDTGDSCPDQPETRNSYFDADGCPDEVPRELLEFVGVIAGIGFEVNSDKLLPKSLPLLDQAAQVVLAFPGVLLQVQGHSSAEGDATANLELSWLRAEAVRTYLVSRGVPPDRVRGKGFGPTKPIASNDTNEGRAQNRRVEFKAIQDWKEAE